MSAGRRLALLEYARRHDAWIVEDDYDSEFRYSGEPIPAMLGMPSRRRWSISAPSAKRCFRRCALALW
jgi:DNA-binding transcriptional MocR family regulator